jgi:hypothetical protein
MLAFIIRIIIIPGENHTVENIGRYTIPPTEIWKVKISRVWIITL